MKQGTDWNRHHGIAPTLLENWVEERAIGDLVYEERVAIPLFNRHGHSVNVV